MEILLFITIILMICCVQAIIAISFHLKFDSPLPEHPAQWIAYLFLPYVFFMYWNKAYTYFVIVLIIIISILSYDGVKRSFSKIHENYKVDIKQNGYLIENSATGKQTFVETGSLEEWFLKDNL